MGMCVLCEEQITNPLSPERLAEEMTTWLAETKPELIEEFQDNARSLFTTLTPSEDHCIINGKRMNVCAYCFTDHTFRWLDKQQVANAIMKEYLTFFNFDITGGGYIKEAIKKGYVL